MELLKAHKSFAGELRYYKHNSVSNNNSMNFSIFLPEQINNKKLSVLYWLSGLTCTDENFMTKAGALKVAAELGLVIVCPDTSSRNNGIEGEDDSYDFGSGAGFYLNATTEQWKKNYNMYDYVVKELPEIINENFNVDPNKKSISGHSMGGHGALTIALKNTDSYKSVSAFSPIVNPMIAPWGQKAFTGYLGKNKESWKEYDATELVLSGRSEEKIPLFIDQGLADDFLEKELLSSNLEHACKKMNHSINLRMQEGYDHSYYFISSFIEDHLRYHIKYLG